MTSPYTLPNDMACIVACIEDQPACDGLALEQVSAFDLHVGQDVVRVGLTIRGHGCDQRADDCAEHFGCAHVRHSITSLPAPGITGRAAVTDMRDPSTKTDSARPAKIARCGLQITEALSGYAHANPEKFSNARKGFSKSRKTGGGNGA